MKSSTKARIARTLLPRPSTNLELANAYAFAREWSHQHAGDLELASKEALYRHLLEGQLRNKPIDYLEFGVYKGDSVRFWARNAASKESRFFGFDSFEGLPESWGSELPAGSFTTAGRTPELGDTRVVFVKGQIQETLSSFLERFSPRGRLVLHLDLDLYSSTLYALTKMDPLLEQSSILLFDEFGTAQEFGAFRDYSRSYRREFTVLGTVRSRSDTSVIDQVALSPRWTRAMKPADPAS